MTLLDNYKNRINNLKAKLRDRAKQIKNLKKRIKEIAKSRDLWKNKVRNLVIKINDLEKQIKQKDKELKKKLIKNCEKPKRYCYSIFIIQMLVKVKLSTSSSFRAVSKIAAIINLYLNLLKHYN